MSWLEDGWTAGVLDELRINTGDSEENSRAARSHSTCLASDRKASHLLPT